jgi:NDP-sugar pyrophosphorylase family protein
MSTVERRIVAVINAGGRSERMAASGVALHKALVPVLGVPLVERNLVVLLEQGFQDIIIVVSAKTPAVEAFVRGRATALAAARGAIVECVQEFDARGNMGIAGQIGSRGGQDLLMTFVDNLTTLDLTRVIDRHRESASAMTIASHVETFSVPHGELRIAGASVIDYVEKPTKPIQVASGIYVLGARATACIPSDRPTGAVDLFRLVKERGESIAAFVHDAPWIDVNDSAAVRRAERLVAGYPGVFDLYDRKPDTTDDCVLVRAKDEYLVRKNIGRDFAGRFDVLRGRDAAWLAEGMTGALMPLARFDDFAEISKTFVRHEVSLAEAGTVELPDLTEGFTWITADGMHGQADLTQPLRRSLALARQRT